MTSVVPSSDSGPSGPGPTTDGAERASGDSTTSRLTRRFGLSLTVVAGVGLLLRLGYVVHIAQDIVLRGDPLTYHLHGQQISSGAGYLRAQLYEATGEPVASAWFPPGHPTLLALLDGLGIDSVVGQKAAMAFVGTGTVVLIGLIGRRLAGPTVGVVAAAVAAVSPMLIVADGALGSETLYMLLVAAFILQLYVMADQDDPRPLRWAALGASVALAAYTRSEGILLLAFLVVPLTFRWPWPWRRRVARAGLASVTMVLVLAPWVVRNYVAFDGFVPISTNGGATLGGANCNRTYYGDARGGFVPSCFDGIGFDELGEDSRTDLNGREFAAEARGRGLEFAAANASAVPSTAAVRVLRTWWMYDAAEQIRLEGFLENRDVEWLRWGYRLHLALLVLGAVGSVVLGRQRLRAWPLWSILAMVSVVSALIYGNMRFRAAAEPALVILGAVGIVALGRAWRSWSPRVSLAQEPPPGPRASARTRRRALAATMTVVLLLWITPAVASVGVWPEGVVADTFDRQAPEPPLGTADTGSEWASVSGGWATEEGRARVVDPAVPSPALTVVDTGFADGRVAVTVDDVEAGSGLVVRYGDPDHYWAVVADPVTGTWTVTKTVEGRTESVGPVAPLGSGSARLEAVRSGARLQFRIGDRMADVIVDPELAGATGAGLITAGDQTRPRWNDFESVPAS